MIKTTKKYFIYLFIIVVNVVYNSDVTAQNFKYPTYHRELALHVDNDALLIRPEFDKYYSSGIYINYRKALNPEILWFKLFNKKDNLVKAIISYSVEQRLYTPQDIAATRISQIDRPYAGWIDFALGLNYHFRQNSVFKIKYDLGLLGPGTGLKELQIWFHGIFNMKEPKGWKYQINNTLATNLTISYQKQILSIINHKADIITESLLQVGTIRDNVRAGFAFRFGKLENLSNSLFTQSKIWQNNGKASDIPMEKRMQEFYFFYRIHGEYVIHNTTIDGNLIGAESAFTKISKPWVLHQEFGIGRGGRIFDFLFSFNLRSKEIIGTKNHQYITTAITHRF